MLNYHGKWVPTTLQELVDPKHAALILIDLQNDFCSTRGIYSKMGRTLTRGDMMIERTKAVLEQARMSKVLHVFIQMTNLPDGLSDSPAWIRHKMCSCKGPDAREKLEQFMKVTIEGSWGWDVVDELKPLPQELRIRKNRSSAFHKTNLDLVLRGNDIKTLVVTGVVTQGCVDSTVRDAVFYGYFPVVLEDCVDSYTRELHDAAMKIMTIRTDVARSDEVLAIWRRPEYKREPIKS